MPGAETTTTEQKFESTSSSSSTSSTSPSSSPTLKTAPLRTVVNAVVSTASPYVSPIVNHVTPYVPTKVLDVTKAVGNKAIDVSNPLIDAADNKVSSYVTLVEKNYGAIPASYQWVQSVNALLPTLPSQVPSAQQVKDSLNHFYSLASSTFIELKDTTKLEEYIQALKQKLSSQWDERLKQPAEIFFEKAKSAFEKAKGLVPADKLVEIVRAQIGAEWEKTIVDTYHIRVESPALYVYKTSVAYFTEVYSKGSQYAAPFSVYLETIKSKLGLAYTDKLEPLLNQLWTTFQGVFSKKTVAQSPSEEQTASASAAASALVNGSSN